MPLYNIDDTSPEALAYWRGRHEGWELGYEDGLDRREESNTISTIESRLRVMKGLRKSTIMQIQQKHNTTNIEKLSQMLMKQGAKIEVLTDLLERLED